MPRPKVGDKRGGVQSGEQALAPKREGARAMGPQELKQASPRRAAAAASEAAYLSPKEAALRDDRPAWKRALGGLIDQEPDGDLDPMETAHYRYVDADAEQDVDAEQDAADDPDADNDAMALPEGDGLKNQGDDDTEGAEEMAMLGGESHHKRSKLGSAVGAGLELSGHALKGGAVGGAGQLEPEKIYGKLRKRT